MKLEKMSMLDSFDNSRLENASAIRGGTPAPIAGAIYSESIGVGGPHEGQKDWWKWCSATDSAPWSNDGFDGWQ